jgi:iron-sulfur cluster repair protein YtfE (RIC family)
MPGYGRQAAEGSGMTATGESLAAALEREHRQIDEGIEGFVADPSSARAAGLLTGAIAALRRHIYLEEEALFPALRRDGESGLTAPIFVMLREHGQLWRTLDELEREVVASAATPGALQLCHQLLVQLQHHNLKEERVLYPEADQVLPPEAAEHLSQLLGSGVLPDGWVCVKARD